jgi:hypothetical protein
VPAGTARSIDPPHPANSGAAGDRVLFTFIGVAMGVLVVLLANELGKRTAKTPPQTAPTPA